MFINALLENLSGVLMEELTSVYIPAGCEGVVSYYFILQLALLTLLSI